jgi:hypothetical protein
MVYTEDQKARIKANPMNRENSRNMRVITTWKYREFQAAERGLAAANDKNRKELTKKYDDAKAIYEEALGKFNLYKELFPDVCK